MLGGLDKRRGVMDGGPRGRRGEMLEDKVGCEGIGGLCSALGHGASLGSSLDSFEHPRPGLNLHPFSKKTQQALAMARAKIP